MKFSMPPFLSFVTRFQVCQVGHLPRVTHQNDLGRRFEQGHQDIEIVAGKILHFVHENERIDTGKTLEDLGSTQSTPEHGDR